jgi:hypothetical protein
MPTDILHGYVTGRFILAVGDATDVDNLPDAVPPIGYVTFSPMEPKFQAETPEPTTVVPYRIRCGVNAAGYLIDPQGEVGVWLVTGTYKVFYTFNNITIASHMIEVLVDHTENFPLNLTNSMPPGGPVLTVSEYEELSARIDAMGSGSVISVNGEDGAVVLDAEDVGALSVAEAIVLTDAIAEETVAREIADTALSGRVDTLEAIDHGLFATDAELSTEASTRSSADATLAGSISTEATTRASEDVILANAINAEATARASADAALDSRVDTLEASAAPDLSGYATDAELAAGLATKANTAHTHDDRYYTETEVDGLISGRASDAELAAESAARVSADSALDTRVDALEAVDHSTFTTDSELAAESAARISADNALDARVDVLEATTGPDLTGYATDAELASEASTRASADAALDTRVDALEAIDHSTFATDAELAAETSARTAADVTLQANIDAKAEAVHVHPKNQITDFDEAVDDRVAALVQDTTHLDFVYNDGGNALQINVSGLATTTSVSDEVTARTAAVAAVQAEVDAAEAAMVASTTIDNIVTITQAAYDALGSKAATTLYVIVG